MDNELRINIPDSLSAMAFAVAGQQKTIDFLREQLDQEIAQRKVSEAVTKEYEEEKMLLQKEKAQSTKDLADTQSALELKEQELVNEKQAFTELMNKFAESDHAIHDLTAWTKAEGEISYHGLMLVIFRNDGSYDYCPTIPSPAITQGEIGMDIAHINERNIKSFCLNYDYLTPLYYRPLITAYDSEQLNDAIAENTTKEEQQ